MHKSILFLVLLCMNVSVFGQSLDTLDDKLASVVLTEFPKMTARGPGAPFHGNYATTLVKHMHGEWAKGKDKYLSVDVSIVDGPEELK